MKKVNINILIPLIAIIFTGCSTDGNSLEATTNNDNTVNTTVPVISTEFKEAYLLELNKARKVQQSCGDEGVFRATTALTWNTKLYQAAYEHSFDLATTNTFSHTGSGQATDLTGVKLGKSSTFQERIEAYGYKYASIGENIGAGTNSDTAKKIVLQLMKSDGHCANIMNPKYKEVGMAMTKNTNARLVYYWTQNFGTPR
jgi:uncharacterized protein YkwD